VEGSEDLESRIRLLSGTGEWPSVRRLYIPLTSLLLTEQLPQSGLLVLT